MPVYIVKIEVTARQTRITIPKVLADKAGIRGRMYCQVELTPQNTIEVSKIELDRKKEGQLPEGTATPDRPA